MSKFTAALNVLDAQIDGHITLCFCDANKSGKVSTHHGHGIATVIDVVYWERVDLTVALVDCDLAIERHEYYKANGYGYDHDFIPHITIGKGNLADEMLSLKGDKLVVGNEYVRTL